MAKRPSFHSQYETNPFFWHYRRGWPTSWLWTNLDFGMRRASHSNQRPWQSWTFGCFGWHPTLMITVSHSHESWHRQYNYVPNAHRSFRIEMVQPIASTVSLPYRRRRLSCLQMIAMHGSWHSWWFRSSIPLYLCVCDQYEIGGERLEGFVGKTIGRFWSEGNFMRMTKRGEQNRRNGSHTQKVSCTWLWKPKRQWRGDRRDLILRFIIGESEIFRWPFELLSIFQVKCRHREHAIFCWMSPQLFSFDTVPAGGR